MLNSESGVVNTALHAVGIAPVNWLTSPSWSLTSVITANIWIGVPFDLVVLHSGRQSIPAGLYEAAALDGAGAWRRFRSIEHLPDDVSGVLAGRIEAHLTPHGLATELPTSPHYLSDGYWRGPIWAPPRSSSSTACVAAGTFGRRTRSAPASAPCARPTASPRTSTP